MRPRNCWPDGRTMTSRNEISKVSRGGICAYAMLLATASGLGCGVSGSSTGSPSGTAGAESPGTAGESASAAGSKRQWNGSRWSHRRGWQRCGDRGNNGRGRWNLDGWSHRLSRGVGLSRSVGRGRKSVELSRSVGRGRSCAVVGHHDQYRRHDGPQRERHRVHSLRTLKHGGTRRRSRP